MYTHCNNYLEEMSFSRSPDRGNRLPNSFYFASLVLYNLFIKWTAILIFREPADNGTYTCFHRFQLPWRYTLREMTLWTCSRNVSRKTWKIF